MSQTPAPVPVSGPWPYPVYVEDATIRDPEWQPIEEGPSNQGEGRKFFWDPIHGSIRVEGPVIQVKPPIRPA